MRKYCSIFGLALIGICSQALAEEATNNSSLHQLSIEQLSTMEVNSASKIASQISAASSAVSIVTAKDIQDYGYHTLAEILESMRGLYITNDRAYSFLGGRGYGRPGDFTGRIMLLVDGNQINNNIYNSANLEYVGILDTSIIERVEYVPGSGSIIYGNNAFFGIINVITKRGHDINGVQVVGEAASHNSKEAKVNYGKRLDNGADILLSASGFNSDGQNLFFPDTVVQLPGSNGVARNLDEQRSRRFFGKMELDSWFAEFAYSTRKKDIPTAPYSADFNAPYHYEDNMFMASLKHDRQLSPSLQMSINSYYGNFNYKGLTTFSSTPFNERSIGQWWGINTQFIGTWFQNQRILMGSELRNDYKQEISNITTHLNTHELTLSLYAQDEITINNQWMASLGARFDSSKDKFDRNLNKVSPRLALIYKPLDTTTVKTSWSTAYRRPNPFEKYYGDNTSVFPNPSLQPERISATELAVEHRLDQDTRILGSIYHNETDDYIRSIDTDPSSATKNQFQNSNGDTTNGAELEFEKHWKNDIRLRTSLAYQKIKTGNGFNPVNSPRKIGKFNLSTPLFNANWRAAIEVQAYSKRYTEDTISGIDDGSYISTGGYSLTNLTITAKKILPNLDVAFGIRNLFDLDYVHVAPNSNFYQTTIPQDDRTYWLRMTYDFK